MSYVGDEATNRRTEWRNQTRWPQEELIQQTSRSSVKIELQAGFLTTDSGAQTSYRYFLVECKTLYITSHNDRE